MMEIAVLGTGCQKCTALVANAEAAAKALGIPYELKKVTAITDIMAYGVMATPALVVNGTVRLSGKGATQAELTEILKTAEAGSADG